MATIKTLLGYVKGPKGDTGETGGTGAPGAAATVEAGTVNTVAYGQPAHVTNVGTPHAAVFNFDIPEGRPGNIGEISRYPVNSITTQAGDFPIPNVGDTIASIVGKQAKATADARYGIQSALDAAAAASASISNILGDFADVEAAATASKAYEVGDYLVLNEQFYKVTAAIAQGNALTPGGNIEPTNVGAEVASLNKEFANWVLVDPIDSIRGSLGGAKPTFYKRGKELIMTTFPHPNTTGATITMTFRSEYTFKGDMYFSLLNYSAWNKDYEILLPCSLNAANRTLAVEATTQFSYFRLLAPIVFPLA